MRFMLMMKADKDFEAGTPPNPELIAAIDKLVEDGMRSGVIVAVGGLYPSACGARLRLSRGKVTVTDGPFTEARELIGGYAIVNVASKEEAVKMSREFLELHARILGPGYEGDAEVRQMFDPTDANAGCRQQQAGAA